MTLTHSADCHDPVCPELHESPRYSALLPLEGDALSLLRPGTDYRVGEIRVHSEPSGIEGERPHETSVIRLDPVEVPMPTIDRELLADAIFMHRLGQYQRSDALESSHLCFEDCAEDIAAHYGKAAR